MHFNAIYRIVFPRKIDLSPIPSFILSSHHHHFHPPSKTLIICTSTPLIRTRKTYIYPSAHTLFYILSSPLTRIPHTPTPSRLSAILTSGSTICITFVSFLSFSFFFFLYGDKLVSESKINRPTVRTAGTSVLGVNTVLFLAVGELALR